MRPRYDENGNVRSWHRMVFDTIPDDYTMKSVLTGSKFNDLSSVGIMKYLRTEVNVEDFYDDKFYSSEVLSYMAMDYIMTAIYLQSAILKDRDGETVSHYTIPCAFCCKHSIELKLKECQIEKGSTELRGHSVLSLWNNLDEKKIPHSAELTAFLEEVEKIDNNEMALRYGISKNLEPLQERYKFDIDSLVSNTMFLFNVLDEYVISKYRYKR